MNFKKIFKRETKVIAYVVIALTLVVIGTSYALFLQVNNNSDNQVVTAGSLVITYSNGNTVNVPDSKDNCLAPQSDEMGSSTGGCKFSLSITNIGSLPMQYDLLIYNNTSEAPSGASFVDHSLIRHSLHKQYSKEETNSGTVTSAEALSELELKEDKRILESSTINVGETITYSLNIWISDEATVDIINKYVYLKLDVVGSVQETDSGNYEYNPDNTLVCKRATTLHTSNCNNSCTSQCAGNEGVGNVIRYGNLGTSGQLTSGDAFDCDVNGDGNYDSNTERFYYVADINSNTASLIYYSNTVNGVPSTSKVAYNISNLPTITQWKNVAAIRSLQLDEVKTACGTQTPQNLNALNSCSYLLENTNYHNEEFPYYKLNEDYYIGYAYYLGGSSDNVAGVRPVIIVPKSNISY